MSSVACTFKYYMSSDRWGHPGNPDGNTFGLTNPFFNDLRSCGTKMVEQETTGPRNNFWGEPMDLQMFVWDHLASDSSNP